jgi:hypothetical protein
VKVTDPEPNGDSEELPSLAVMETGAEYCPVASISAKLSVTLPPAALGVKSAL